MGDNNIQNNITDSNQILHTAPNTLSFNDVYCPAGSRDYSLCRQQTAISGLDASLSTIQQTYMNDINSATYNSDGTLSSATANALHKDFNNVNNLQKSILNNVVDIRKYYGEIGTNSQHSVMNNNPYLRRSSEYLNKQVKKANTLRSEILEAKGIHESDKLQSKSYWMQSSVLLVIFLIFVGRILAATYSNKTGTIDLIIAVSSLVVLLYIYWNSIWDPIVNYSHHLKKTFFNINI